MTFMIDLMWCKDCKVNSEHAAGRKKAALCPVCHSSNVICYSIQGSARQGKASRAQARPRKAAQGPHPTPTMIG